MVGDLHVSGSVASELPSGNWNRSFLEFGLTDSTLSSLRVVKPQPLRLMPTVRVCSCWFFWRGQSARGDSAWASPTKERRKA